jgi:hypothetical protein
VYTHPPPSFLFFIADSGGKNIKVILSKSAKKDFWIHLMNKFSPKILFRLANSILLKITQFFSLSMKACQQS